MLALAATTTAASFRAGSDAMGAFLSHHFGDGLVYLTGTADHALLREAVRQGFVSDDGYLTRHGYRYWRQYAV